MDLYGELEWRGLVYDATEGVRDALARGAITGYIGFDPTAPSLHVGSLLQMIALAHLQRHGHSPIAVVGGGTGLIGDPKPTTERALLSVEKVEENVAGLRVQLARFLDFDARGNPARLVNNAEWLTRLSAIDFMRDVGKHFTINAMLAKEAVKRRIESEEGISYTEFSYALLQAYDYLELYDRFGCTLQMGGSDQWGNITSGMDLIRRVRGVKTHGLVLPLIMTSAGTKFGKTEAGTVWLDPALTTPYEFYQFWLNADDRDAVRYLKFFTFLDEGRVSEIAGASAREPEKRHAQRELAREVTRLVHGDDAVRDAEAKSASLFTGDPSAMSNDELLKAFANDTHVVAVQSDGWRVQTLLTEGGLTKSLGEAARLIRGRGVRVNGELFTDETKRLHLDDAKDGELFLIQKGKKDFLLVRIERG